MSSMPVEKSVAMRSLRVGVLAVIAALALAACASTVAERDDGGGDDDVAPADAAVNPFIDAALPPDAPPPPPGTPDASPPPPPPPDAAVPPMSTPDAAVPTGPFCTLDSQCNQSAHECCWLFLGSQGGCVYGDVWPILGCVPSDPPDAGAP
jgi:hypothetical protein